MKKIITIILISIISYFCYSQIVVSPAYHAVQYGSQLQLPIVVTSEITEIWKTTAISGGDVIHDGNTNITGRGVVWSTSENPTIEENDDYTIDGSGLGEFTSNLTVLTAGTKYYLRAYATNQEGTAYGEQFSFTTIADLQDTDASPCLGTETVTYDSYTYNTVQIGLQCWFAENLRYLPSVTGPEAGSQTEPYYYVYGYDGTSVSDAKSTSNYQTYGVLYNWEAAMTSCPVGWALPSDSECTELTHYLIANGYNYDGTTEENKIAKSLAAKTNWHITPYPGAIGNNLSANNSTGFSALPGGYRYENGSFVNIGSAGGWWSSTQYSITEVWSRSLGYNIYNKRRDKVNKEIARSARCIKEN